MNSALIEYRKLAVELQKRLEEAKLGATANGLREASSSVNESVISLENTLQKINSAIDELTMLLRLLNEQPNALIRGKRF